MSFALKKFFTSLNPLFTYDLTSNSISILSEYAEAQDK